MSDPAPDPIHAARLKKLAFRASHRGFREADLILGAFADLRLAGFGDAQLDAFEALIDHPDHDLYSWIVGQAEAPAACEGEMLDQIREFRLSLHAVRGDAMGA